MMILGIIGGALLGILLSICCYDAYKSQQYLNQIQQKNKEIEQAIYISNQPQSSTN